jgi:tetratricopeptide (TPR) repeat protein
MKRFISITVLLVTGVALEPAYADDSASTHAEEDATAADHAKKGQVAYDVQDWATAIREYREAYRLDQKPEYLWALAQALRLSNDYAGAIRVYQAYKRSDVTIAQSDAAETMVVKCEAEIAKREADAAKKKTAEVPLRPSTKPPNEPSTRKGISPVLFTISAAATLALGAVTLWSGLDVLSKNQSYEDSPTRAAFDDGRARELRTNVLAITTGVALGTTAVIGIFLTDWSAPRNAARPSFLGMAVAPIHGGGLLGIGGKF